jgi:hypothetical protein
MKRIMISSYNHSNIQKPHNIGCPVQTPEGMHVWATLNPDQQVTIYRYQLLELETEQYNT